jgi:hypothetical protein
MNERCYQSPFGKIDYDFSKLDFDKIQEQQVFKGSLAQTIDELQEAVAGYGAEHATRVALHPPRIIKAVVDYKINNPDATGSFGLVREAIALGVDVYRGDSEIGGKIEQFREQAGEVGGAALMGSLIEQKVDRTTWHASDPQKSRHTAGRLSRVHGNEGLLFIALAHGGVAAGMDSYLQYRQQTNSDSAFHVVRYSRDKLGDREPRVSSEESAFLQEQSVGRGVVVFDEDACSGNTISIAGDFFSSEIFSGKRVTKTVNEVIPVKAARLGLV